MESIGEVVAGWLGSADLTPRSAAKRAGVSPSTLHRVLHGHADPSISTLVEIAAACNIALDLTGSPLSDADASAAARSLLEDGYEWTDPGVRGWRERLLRRASLEQPVAIMEEAAAAANPLARTSARLFAGNVPLVQIASAGHATNQGWALSGVAGLELGLPPEEGEVPGITILWAENASLAAELLPQTAPGVAPTASKTRATIAVIETGPALFTNSFEDAGIRYCAPIQIMLDCLALPGQASQLAASGIRSW